MFGFNRLQIFSLHETLVETKMICDKNVRAWFHSFISKEFEKNITRREKDWGVVLQANPKRLPGFFSLLEIFLDMKPLKPMPSHFCHISF